jgi:catechol 2,3-dioxygenase-like lactoylglutathione lyase family enzyme
MPPMLDHIGFVVSEFDRSKRFYTAALAPLSITLLLEVTPEQTGLIGSHAGFGAAGKPFFWIGNQGRPAQGLHVAFTASSRQLVDQFYHEALRIGGRDNGAPGLRPHYHENYYGAFILDPDGNNVEAVCHSPG